MDELSRREFFSLAAALGASTAWAGARIHPSRTFWRERRDLYPEGVASGDPTFDSVLLWTRRPFDSGDEAKLTVELAEDQTFRHVMTTASRVFKRRLAMSPLEYRRAHFADR